MAIKTDQILEISIHRLGVNGEGVGDFQGFTLFVDGALPGETVVGKVTEVRRNFGRAILLEITIPSSDRIKPICPVFGMCGGCQIMHLSYEQQLKAKRQRVIDAFERIGKVKVDVTPCHPSPMPLAYRNKIQLPIDGEKVGLYMKNSHEVVDVKKCYIHCSLGEKIYEWLRTYPEIKKFDNILIRTGVKTGETLLAFVTETPFIPPNIPEEVKGIVQWRKKGNRVLGEPVQVLFGRDWIEEELNGLSFQISAASFFQVNPFQAEHLYNEVVKCADLTGKETVLDSYCGVGTLALILAKNAKEVIGVESIPAAIEDAKANAERNRIKNARFYCEKVEDFIPSLDKVDVAILNPPRKGCEPEFLVTLETLKPKRIVYVSCDPATLARDVAFLNKCRYNVGQVNPFDMFPQTSHVECVVQLTR